MTASDGKVAGRACPAYRWRKGARVLDGNGQAEGSKTPPYDVEGWGWLWESARAGHAFLKVAVGEVTGHCCVCCRIRSKSPCVSSAKAVYYYYNSILGGIAMMKIYRTQDSAMTRVDDMNEGAWMHGQPHRRRCPPGSGNAGHRARGHRGRDGPRGIGAYQSGGRLYGHHRGHPRQGGRCRRGHLYDYPPGHPADAGADRHGLLHRYRRYREFAACRVRGSRPARKCGSSTSCSTARPRCTSRSCA